MVIQQATPAVLSKEVLYIGSAVPLETSEGLEAVQQPLRLRYPVDSEENVEGILSILSILPSGIQLHYKSDPSNVVLFPFSTLTMCAAVRCVKMINEATNEITPRFVSLSSPEAGGANSQLPAIFTAITRRTKGRQVLECHGFITSTPKDALDLVQWTAVMDKRSKHGGTGTSRVAAGSATYNVSRGDTSFYTDTASLPEFPIQLVPGEPLVPNASPAFYKEPPPNGYFYSTNQAQVKKFSLHKFSGNASVEESQSVSGSGADHVVRRPLYAASQHSASAAMFSPQPRHPVMVPVRGYPPSYVRPMLVRPPPPQVFAYPRPRFFSPPPAVRVRPIPVFVPPPVPVIYNNDYHIRPVIGRRGSRTSSRSSSASSILESAHLNGRPHRRLLDDSSELSSRPRTPPTDYDAPRGPRVSRKDDFYEHQTVARDGLGSTRVVNGSNPKGYYFVPQYGYYSLPPGAGRPRSVPPYVETSRTKNKSKDAKKNKKNKKKASRKGKPREGVHDESTDSVGYTSELSPNSDNRQPRDFRRMENQFKHERAFSKSLAEETRHSDRSGRDFNAYSLNNTAGNHDNEFPTAVY